MKVRFLNQARADLDDIAFYIALDSLETAPRIADEIIARLKSLEQFPNAGREREELAAGLRSWPIGSYVAYYRVTKREVQVVRLLHGRQDAQRQVWDS